MVTALVTHIPATTTSTTTPARPSLPQTPPVSTHLLTIQKRYVSCFVASSGSRMQPPSYLTALCTDHDRCCLLILVLLRPTPPSIFSQYPALLLHNALLLCCLRSQPLHRCAMPPMAYRCELKRRSSLSLIFRGYEKVVWCIRAIFHAE